MSAILKVGRPYTLGILRHRYLPAANISRWSSTNTQTQYNHLDVEALLETPTWSVESLLPPAEGPTDSPAISSKQLHHLLRLSALPPPKSPEDEADMLKTLSNQLHFINEIRKVDTTSIQPLQSLRDETSTGQKNDEVGMEDLKEAFAREEVKGEYHKRIRRREDVVEGRSEAEDWDVLGATRKRVGRFFVVEGGKAGAE